MPKEQFFNLTKDKQNILISAAKEEFSKVPFELASINQIVKNANISRGSFYMYFEDKLDLLTYIMSDYKNEFHKTLDNAVIKCDGNIFEIFIDIFDYISNYITTSDDFKFAKNIFANLKISSQIEIPGPHEKDINHCIYSIKEKIVNNNRQIKDDKQLIDVIEILIGITKCSIVDIAFFDKDVNLVKETYANKLKIIENGISK